MRIEVLVTPHVWLQVSPEVRRLLAREFGIRRSGSPYCVTQGGQTRVESDGHTVDDLRAMNAYTMQKWLGKPFIDTEADVVALFRECAEAAERMAADGADAPHAPPVPEGPAVPDACAECGSRGGKHKKTCVTKQTV